jgi:hypothetical protein
MVWDLRVNGRLPSRARRVHLSVDDVVWCPFDRADDDAGAFRKLDQLADARQVGQLQPASLPSPGLSSRRNERAAVQRMRDRAASVRRRWDSGQGQQAASTSNMLAATALREHTGSAVAAGSREMALQDVLPQRLGLEAVVGRPRLFGRRPVSI